MTRIPHDANLITLYRDHGFWMALFSGPKSDSVRRLFGTTALPTPFGADASETLVYDVVQRGNPDYLVLIEPEATR